LLTTDSNLSRPEHLALKNRLYELWSTVHQETPLPS